MKYKIVGVSGKARVGKDLLSDLMVKQYGWHHVSLASYLKLECRRKYGLTLDQTDGHFKDSPTSYKRTDGRYYNARDILIHEGKFTREVDPDYYVRHLESSFIANKINIISDVRFPNEANYVKKMGGFLIRLNRNVQLRGVDIHDYSETALDLYPNFDLVVPEKWNDIQDTMERVVVPTLKVRVADHYHETIV